MNLNIQISQLKDDISSFNVLDEKEIENVNKFLFFNRISKKNPFSMLLT